jgi:hypothetical protein
MNIDKPEVDVCFLVDCTGSMRNYIEAIKKNVKQVTIELEKKFGKSDIRFAFVRYTDYDVTNATTFVDFTSDHSELESFLCEISASGGDDSAEDAMGGLKVAFDNLGWRPLCTKVLLHIADFPCHGDIFHDQDVSDKYPGGDIHGLTHKEMMARVVEKKVHYWFGYIHPKYTDRMVSIFNEHLQNISDGKMIIRQFDAMEHDKLLATTVRAISTSICEIEADKNTHCFDLSKRGLAVIVSCDYDGTLPTNDDRVEMCKTFEYLEYDVHPMSNPTGSQIIQMLKNVKHYLRYIYKNGNIYNKEDSGRKAIVFAFSGHGGNEDFYDYILGEDRTKLFVFSDIMHQLLGLTGSAMHIPKLFFFDACRGTHQIYAPPDDHLAFSFFKLNFSKDNTPATEDNEEYVVNFRIDYSTIPGHKSPASDRWMKIVATALRERNESIHNIMAEVKKKIYEQKHVYPQLPYSMDQLVTGPLKLCK